MTNNLDPTDRDLAKKRAREAAESDLFGLDEYIKENPTLDKYGYPIDPLADFVWEAGWAAEEDDEIV